MINTLFTIFGPLTAVTTVWLHVVRAVQRDRDRARADAEDRRRALHHAVAVSTAPARRPMPPKRVMLGPPRPSFWDIVVGIPLDDWVQARTTDDMRRLIRRRDGVAS